MISFKKNERNNFTLVEFVLEGAITPEIFPEVSRKLEELKLKMNKGIVISGRGPIWLYAFICHKLHPSKWLAVFDPRLGAVVVQSHTPEVKEGGIVKIDG